MTLFSTLPGSSADTDFGLELQRVVIAYGPTLLGLLAIAGIAYLAVACLRWIVSHERSPRRSHLAGLLLLVLNCFYLRIIIWPSFNPFWIWEATLCAAYFYISLMLLAPGSGSRYAGVILMLAAYGTFAWPPLERSNLEWLAIVVLCFFALLLIGTGRVKAAGAYFGMTSLGVFLMAPFVWMLLVSFLPSKTPIPPLNELVPVADMGRVMSGKGAVADEFKTTPQDRLAAKASSMRESAVTNYDFVLNHPTLPVSRFFFNSLFVTVVIVLGQLFITSLAAYGFSRLKFRGREAVFWLFLGSMMFAGPVTQIPVYLMLKNLGWLDTYLALMIPGISSAFSVFMLRQFFMQIPLELDEAARIDGAGDFLIYWRVVLPLSRAALATAAAFTFFGVWTDFFNPLIYTNSTEMRTLEVGLSIFKNSYGGSNWPLQMTAAVIVMVPLLMAFLFTQRYFTKGITLGSIK